MSGPKVTVYAVTPEQKRILKLQLKEEKKLRGKMNLLRICWTELEKYVEDSGNLMRLLGTDNGFSQNLIEIQEKALAYSQTFEKTAKYGGLIQLQQAVRDITIHEEELKNRVEQLEKIAKENAIILKNQLNQRVSSYDTSMGVCFELPNDDRPITEESSVSEEINEMKEVYLELLKNFAYNPLLTIEKQEKLKSLQKNIDNINELSYLKNTLAIQIKPLIKECEKFLIEQKAYFKKLINEYQVLCELMNLEPELFEESYNDIQLLKEVLIKLNEQSEIRSEEHYIQQSIQEVMVDMGYNLLGEREVTKKNGSHFRNELFHYDDGTAVNVTYSENGNISMELGGLGDHDNLPTTDESTFLLETMTSFCSDFKHFEQKLTEKGVLLQNRISLLPPHEDFAQMINVKDYNMEKKVDLLEVKKKKTKFEKKKSNYMG